MAQKQDDQGQDVQAPAGLKFMELAITISALFMVLIGLLLYFYHDALSLDKETAKILVIACVAFAIFELVVIKKLLVQVMTKK